MFFMLRFVPGLWWNNNTLLLWADEATKISVEHEIDLSLPLCVCVCVCTDIAPLGKRHSPFDSKLKCASHSCPRLKDFIVSVQKEYSDESGGREGAHINCWSKSFCLIPKPIGVLLWKYSCQPSAKTFVLWGLLIIILLTLSKIGF